MRLRQRLLTARVAIIVVVLIATLSNLNFSPDLADASRRLAQAFAPSFSWSDLIDVVRNVALFGGLGVVWVGTADAPEARRTIWRATAVAFALSVTVEGIQTFSPVRDASIADVTTDTLGAYLGAVVTQRCLSQVRRSAGAPTFLGFPMFVVSVPYALAALCETITPLFHSELTQAINGGPLHHLAVMLVESRQLSWREVPLTDVPLFAAAGFLLVAMLTEWRRSSTSLVTATLGTLVVVFGHLLHGMFGLAIRWEAVATDAAALSVGAWLAHRSLVPLVARFRGARRARATMLAYGALLTIWGWRPFIPELSVRRFTAQEVMTRLIPLGSLSGREDMFSAVHVAQQFLLYLPLGALLAIWPLPFADPRATLWPAAAFAIVIELGHLVIRDRMFDATNVWLALAGLGAGWVLVKRSGYAPRRAVEPVRHGERPQTGR